MSQFLQNENQYMMWKGRWQDIKEMTVEPRTDSYLDTKDDNVNGPTDTFTPKQRDLVV